MVLTLNEGGTLTGQVFFQCYSQQCFLSEVWAPGQYAGRRLLKSRREQEAAKKIDAADL